MIRAIQVGVLDLPKRPFREGEVLELGTVPQTQEDLMFGDAEVQKGLETGLYLKVSKPHAERAIKRGAMISSSFTVWQDNESE